MNTIWIDYTNYKGERAWREVYPFSVAWAGKGHLYHPNRHVLTALDLQKGSDRDFDLLNIHAFSAEAPQSEILREVNNPDREAK